MSEQKNLNNHFYLLEEYAKHEMPKDENNRFYFKTEYFWDNKGKIIAKDSFKELEDGHYEVKHRNYKIIIKNFNIKDGKREGEFYEHNCETDVCYYCEFKNDIKVGKFKEEYNGKIKKEGFYDDNGNLHGNYNIYDTYGGCLVEQHVYDHGLLKSKQINHINGSMHEKIYFVNDKVEGIVKIYNKNGELEKEMNFKNGTLHGQYITYDGNNKKTSEAEFFEGEKKGIERKWGSDNKLYSEVEHNDIKLNDNKESDNNHNKKWEKFYYDNEKLMCFNEYDEKGNLKIKEFYDESGRDCILKDGKIVVYKACISKIKNIIRDEKNSNFEFKKSILSVHADLDNIPVYVTLEVPEDAKRITPVCRYYSKDGIMPEVENVAYKSRIDKAKVLSIKDEYGNEYSEAYSFVTNNSFVYQKDKNVYAESFENNVYLGCCEGIHVHPYKDQCDQWFCYLSNKNNK